MARPQSENHDRRRSQKPSRNVAATKRVVLRSYKSERLSWAPNGRLLVISSYDEVRAWSVSRELRTTQKLRYYGQDDARFSYGRSKIESLAVADDAIAIAVGFSEGNVCAITSGSKPSKLLPQDDQAFVNVDVSNAGICSLLWDHSGIMYDTTVLFAGTSAGGVRVLDFNRANPIRDTLCSVGPNSTVLFNPTPDSVAWLQKKDSCGFGETILRVAAAALNFQAVLQLVLPGMPPTADFLSGSVVRALL